MARSGSQVDSAEITVLAPAIGKSVAKSLVFSSPKVTLAALDTVVLTFVVKDSLGVAIGGKTPVFKPVDPRVAKVVEVRRQFLLFGLRRGATVIEASADSGKASLQVEVGPAAVAFVEFPSDTLTLAVGATARLEPRALDRQRNPTESTPLKWSSSREGAVRVSPNGEIIALTRTPGVDIRATSPGGAVGTVQVKVSYLQ